MKNQEIAQILYEIGYFLEMEGVPFKPYAYQKAAIVLDGMEEDVAEIYKRGGKKALEGIPAVGPNIAERIEEYLKSGKVKYYQELKKKMPVKIEELMAVEGIGPKTIKALYHHLKVKDLNDLEKAVRLGKIKKLPGFGEKSEQNILQAILFLKRGRGRFLLGEISPRVKEILARLKARPEIEQINIAGSVRRRKETIGDVDILVTSKDPQHVMDFFVSMPGVEKIWSKGPTRASVRMEQKFDVDLRVVPEKSFGSALQYFTGSKDHNIATRRIAIEKGLKLNEYGVFRGKKMVAGRTEEGIYKILGMDWIEPELRENQGEIEAALRPFGKAQDKQAQGKPNGLPKIINYKDIRGDLHCHSKWDGGENTIEEMAEAAQKMGYEYLGIADHTKFLRIEHGLDEKQLAQQRREIEKLNLRFKSNPPGSKQQNLKFRILQGCEANILKDGSIDIKDEALKKLDYAIAGIHSGFKTPKEKMTERLIRAMKNPHIDVISHPTGRIIQRRDEYQIDFDKILRAAREFNVILEINSYPERLDLNDQNIRRAKEAGVKMVINTDSHQKGQLRFIEFGIAQARRGWAEKEDIINTQPLEKLLKFFKK